MGDDVQTMKAGIMEIGDVLVINKADRDGVLRTEKELEGLLSLSGRLDEWQPLIVKTVAIENKGIDELAAAITRTREAQQTGDGGSERKRAIARWRILELLRERLVAETMNGDSAAKTGNWPEVAAKTRDPYSAVDELLETVRLIWALRQ
jgi:LAO/AO transport system kinase